MTAAHNEYEEVHRLVDHLSATQVRRLRLLVAQDPELGKIAGALAEAHDASHSSEAVDKPRRRSLGFIGTLEAEPDLAERSAEIVREGLGGTE
ncbi:hypothetical protein ACQPW1_41565 [Nocardia sp. CA-128927]|uniref:hypothetical protein n=1 Tax=Nocardia sp. CA-128927 TaxID=3239975 RepID=UPI003D95629B